MCVSPVAYRTSQAADDGGGCWTWGRGINGQLGRVVVPRRRRRHRRHHHHHHHGHGHAEEEEQEEEEEEEGSDGLEEEATEATFDPRPTRVPGFGGFGGDISGQAAASTFGHPCSSSSSSSSSTSSFVVVVAAGNMHTAVVDASGAAWTWGLNTTGQLGLATPASYRRGLSIHTHTHSARAFARTD